MALKSDDYFERLHVLLTELRWYFRRSGTFGGGRNMLYIADRIEDFLFNRPIDVSKRDYL